MSTPTLISEAHTSGTGAGVTQYSVLLSVQAGDLIHAICANAIAINTFAFSDSQSNAYTSIDYQSNSGSYSGEHAYAIASSSGSLTITATLASSDGHTGMWGRCIRGAAASPLGGHGAGYAAASSLSVAVTSSAGGGLISALALAKPQTTGETVGFTIGGSAAAIDASGWTYGGSANTAFVTHGTSASGSNAVVATPSGITSPSIWMFAAEFLGGVVAAQKGGMFFAENAPKLSVKSLAMFMPLGWVIGRRNRMRQSRAVGEPGSSVLPGVLQDSQ